MEDNVGCVIIRCESGKSSSSSTTAMFLVPKRMQLSSTVGKCFCLSLNKVDGTRSKAPEEVVEEPNRKGGNVDNQTGNAI